MPKKRHFEIPSGRFLFGQSYCRGHTENRGHGSNLVRGPEHARVPVLVCVPSGGVASEAAELRAGHVPATTVSSDSGPSLGCTLSLSGATQAPMQLQLDA